MQTNRRARFLTILLQGGPIVVRMRYSEFDDLRQRLVSSFPHARSALPALPPKSVLCKNQYVLLYGNFADKAQTNSDPSSWRIGVLDWSTSSSGYTHTTSWTSANRQSQLCPSQPGVLRLAHRQGLSFRSNVLKPISPHTWPASPGVCNISRL